MSIKHYTTVHAIVCAWLCKWWPQLLLFLSHEIYICLDILACTAALNKTDPFHYLNVCYKRVRSAQGLSYVVPML